MYWCRVEVRFGDGDIFLYFVFLIDFIKGF